MSNTCNACIIYDPANTTSQNITLNGQASATSFTISSNTSNSSIQILVSGASPQVGLAYQSCTGYAPCIGTNSGNFVYNSSNGDLSIYTTNSRSVYVYGGKNVGGYFIEDSTADSSAWTFTNGNLCLATYCNLTTSSASISTNSALYQYFLTSTTSTSSASTTGASSISTNSALYQYFLTHTTNSSSNSTNSALYQYYISNSNSTSTSTRTDSLSSGSRTASRTSSRTDSLSSGSRTDSRSSSRTGSRTDSLSSGSRTDSRSSSRTGSRTDSLLSGSRTDSRSSSRTGSILSGSRTGSTKVFKSLVSSKKTELKTNREEKTTGECSSIIVKLLYEIPQIFNQFIFSLGNVPVGLVQSYIKVDTGISGSKDIPISFGPNQFDNINIAGNNNSGGLNTDFNLSSDSISLIGYGSYFNQIGLFNATDNSPWTLVAKDVDSLLTANINKSTNIGYTNTRSSSLEYITNSTTKVTCLSYTYEETYEADAVTYLPVCTDYLTTTSVSSIGYFLSFSATNTKTAEIVSKGYCGVELIPSGLSISNFYLSGLENSTIQISDISCPSKSTTSFVLTITIPLEISFLISIIFGNNGLELFSTATGGSCSYKKDTADIGLNGNVSLDTTISISAGYEVIFDGKNVPSFVQTTKPKSSVSNTKLNGFTLEGFGIDLNQLILTTVLEILTIIATNILINWTLAFLTAGTSIYLTIFLQLGSQFTINKLADDEIKKYFPAI